MDVLINNAGLGLERADAASAQDWQRMIGTNITGLVTMTHLLLPQMTQRNRGHIVNIGSIAGNWLYPGGNVCGATKAFVKQFSLNLRADLAGIAVRVSNVKPGLCGGTEFSSVRFHGGTERAARVYEGVQALTPKTSHAPCCGCGSRRHTSMSTASSSCPWRKALRRGPSPATEPPFSPSP